MAIHAIRLVNIFKGQGCELHFYAWDEDPVSGPLLHKKLKRTLKLPPLRNTTIHFPKTARDPTELAKLIAEIQPDIVHSMPIQGASYHVHLTKKIMGEKFPPWFVSCWGQDMHLFGRLNDHRQHIRDVMSSCDYFISESAEDIELAKKFGFKGRDSFIMTTSPGFDVRKIAALRNPRAPSKRKWIVLKGYQHFYGRALTALKALELCASDVANYKIGIYAASPSVEIAAQLLSIRTGLSIQILPVVSHQQQLRRVGKARVTISNNLSDGVPNTMLEAMLLGAFPIQSDTARTATWLVDGVSGLNVCHDDPHAIAAALRMALLDDRLVDHAAEINFKLAEKELNAEIVRQRFLDAYKSALA